MSAAHKLVLTLSCLIIAGELSVLAYYHRQVFDWLSHNLWVIFVPFAKAIFKRLIALKLLVFLKAFGALLVNLSKLLLLKTVKTLGIRYGVFFSQNRWYWVRRGKVMFLRRGRQFFRSARHFWAAYSDLQRWVIAIAFFPVVLALFILGLSFNVTRKTMVKKTQERAIFKTALKTGASSKGVRAWVENVDRKTLQKIKDLTPRGQSVRQAIEKTQE